MVEVLLKDKKLRFASIDEITKNAALSAEAAFAFAVDSAVSNPVDEEGEYQRVYFKCYPEQVAILEEASKRFPQHTKVYANKIGELFFDSNQPEKALPYLEKAFSAKPIDNPNICRLLPSNNNKLAIIYLMQNRGADAKSVLKQGLELKSYSDAGTDVLLSYSYILTGENVKALNISQEAIRKFAKLREPDITRLSHDIAASLKAVKNMSDSIQANSFFDNNLHLFNEGIRKSIESELKAIYGTANPDELAELVPTSNFEHLKWLKYGDYHEPID